GGAAGRARHRSRFRVRRRHHRDERRAGDRRRAGGGGAARSSRAGGLSRPRPRHAGGDRRARARRRERVDHERAGIDTFYGKSHILHEVSLEVRAGEVVGLLGRNGAGKSSTLKSVMGLVAPARGRVEFTGRDITGHSPEEISRLGMGFVPQGRRLFPNLTVSENLALGRLRRRGGDGVRWEQERIFEFFPRVRERLDEKAETLSGGEQQMVAIARALSGRVKLLLLDEPFEGLAPAVTETIFAALDRLRGEVPILIVEHDLDLVLALADRI